MRTRGRLYTNIRRQKIDTINFGIELPKEKLEINIIIHVRPTSSYANLFIVLLPFGYQQLWVIFPYSFFINQWILLIEPFFSVSQDFFPMVLHPYGCCIACPSCSRNHDPHNDHTPSPPSRSTFRHPLMCRRWSWGRLQGTRRRRWEIFLLCGVRINLSLGVYTCGRNLN